MNVVGLITEYNPFHNGHKYHLEKSKETSGASCSIAVMGGNFLQRGEPALLDKWTRAEIAIREGVDLVIELPTIFSCNSAEFFAFGGISLLDSLGVVDSFCFGSELGELDDLQLISNLLTNEPLEFKNLLKSHLDKGLTFPLARQMAMKQYLGNNLSDINALSSPNNILGIEYLKALKLLKSKIIPLTIKRIAAEYNSTEINGEICSATAIRKFLEENHNSLEYLKNVVPSNSHKIISSSIEKGKGPVFVSDIEQIIFYKLRTIPMSELKKIHDISEGLENRLKSGGLLSATYNGLIQFLKTKRYTQTRLQRTLLKTIIGITNDDIVSLSGKIAPQYIRVLGFNDKGASLLKQIKRKSELPIITNLKRYRPQNNIANRMIEIDKIATDIYTLLYNKIHLTNGGQDFTNKPFIQ